MRTRVAELPAEIEITSPAIKFLFDSDQGPAEFEDGLSFMDAQPAERSAVAAEFGKSFPPAVAGLICAKKTLMALMLANTGNRLRLKFIVVVPCCAVA